MKKIYLFFFFVFGLFSINAQNYGNGNGSILSEETYNNSKIVRRKHVQTVKMSEDYDVPAGYKSLWDDFSYLYNSDYTLMQEWGKVPLIEDCTGKTINILEIIKISSDDYEYPYLFKVEVEGLTGYMRSYDLGCRFYEEGIWSIIGQIESSGRKWTIRNVKDSGDFEIKERLYVRNKPGTRGTKKIFLFYENEELPKDKHFYGKKIKVKNITEEKEIIDGIEGRWLNIEYENIEGWVFEGYVFCDSIWGYYNPEGIIDYVFTYGVP